MLVQPLCGAWMIAHTSETRATAESAAPSQSMGCGSGLRDVASDAGRFLFDQRAFMAEHFRTADTPGPIGHGFTPHNLSSGETWWQADLSPHVRAFGLDTCNQVAGADGAVPDDQFRWLTTQLQQAQTEQRLVLVFSHHNSLTLENRATRPGLGVQESKNPGVLDFLTRSNP